MRRPDTPNGDSSVARARPAGDEYAAVVLYYRLGPAIKATIDALIAQTHAPAAILVVDNASNDGVVDELFDDYKNVKIIRLLENEGYAGGMNAGHAALETDLSLVLFMTHEVLLDRGCVEALVQGLRSGNHGLVGPELYRGESGAIWSVGGAIDSKGSVQHRDSPSIQGVADWLDGACLLFDESLFRKIGGFDEDYFLYWEDVDIGSRVNEISSVACITDAHASQETGTMPVYFGARNQILYWRKRRNGLKILSACLLSVAKIACRDLRARNASRAQARAWGVIHGLTGAITLQYSSIREG